jgi:hypothetical protein
MRKKENIKKLPKKRKMPHRKVNGSKFPHRTLDGIK